jgi:hypothetical protein
VKTRALTLFTVAALTGAGPAGATSVAHAEPMPDWASYIDKDAQAVLVPRMLANGRPACGNIPKHTPSKAARHTDDDEIVVACAPSEPDLARDLALFEQQNMQQQARPTQRPQQGRREVISVIHL